MGEALCTDFGGVKRARPKAVLSARSGEADPGALIAAAGQRGDQVTLRGAGHSCNGQTVTDGLLLENFRPHEAAGPHIVDAGDDCVEIPAFLSWHAVERELNTRGRAVPVLTDYLHLSVGGTLSVGGLGLNSVVHGLQADQVRRIRLIDGQDAARWCSLEEHPELFRFALGGLGQAGLIDRVILSTVPYRRFAHLHRVHHASATEMARFAVRLSAEPDVDHYNANINGDQFYSEIGWFHDEKISPCPTLDCTIIPDLPFFLHERRERWIAAFPGRVRIWTDYVLPPDRFGVFIDTIENLRNQPPLSGSLKGMYVLLIRRPTGFTRFAFGPAPHHPVVLGLGVYAMVDQRDALTIVQTCQALRSLLELCCELGGRPYLYGMNSLDATLLRNLYGSDLDQLAALRRTYGLEHVNTHVLNPTPTTAVTIPS
jgi:FAD/FMN-containing dehydrogenase